MEIGPLSELLAFFLSNSAADHLSQSQYAVVYCRSFIPCFKMAQITSCRDSVVRDVPLGKNEIT